MTRRIGRGQMVVRGERLASNITSPPLFRLGLELSPIMLRPAPVDRATTPPFGASARAAEAAGFDTVWVNGAAMGPFGPAAEPCTLAGGLVGETASVRLGVVVSLRDGRHSAVLARDVSALDVVSSGRAAVAVTDATGGWTDADDAPPIAVNAILDRLARAATILRATFTGTVADPATAAELAAEFPSGQAPVNRPGPIQSGGPGIVILLPDKPESGSGSGLVDCAHRADALAIVGEPEVMHERCAAVRAAIPEARLTPVPILWRGALPADRAGAVLVVRQVINAGVDGLICSIDDRSPSSLEVVGAVAALVRDELD